MNADPMNHSLSRPSGVGGRGHHGNAHPLYVRGHGAGPQSGKHHQPVSSPNLIASWIFIRTNIQMNAGKANARITPRMA